MADCSTCGHPPARHDPALTSAAGDVACLDCPDGTCYRMPAGRGPAEWTELEGLADELEVRADVLAALVGAIAAQTAARLRDEHVIPAEIPARIGAAIRAGNGGRAMFWHYPIPLSGPDNITTRWTLLPNGGLHLELTDGAGAQFWQGTLRPAEGGTRG